VLVTSLTAVHPTLNRYVSEWYTFAPLCGVGGVSPVMEWDPVLAEWSFSPGTGGSYLVKLRMTVSSFNAGGVTVEALDPDTDAVLATYVSRHYWNPARRLAMKRVSKEENAGIVWEPYPCLSPAMFREPAVPCCSGTLRSVGYLIELPAMELDVSSIPPGGSLDPDIYLCGYFPVNKPPVTEPGFPARYFEGTRLVVGTCGGALALFPNEGMSSWAGRPATIGFDVKTTAGTGGLVNHIELQATLSLEYIAGSSASGASCLTLRAGANLASNSEADACAWLRAGVRTLLTLSSPPGYTTVLGDIYITPILIDDGGAIAAPEPLLLDCKSAPPYLGPCEGTSVWILRRQAVGSKWGFFRWELKTPGCVGRCGSRRCSPVPPWPLPNHVVTNDAADALGYTEQVDTEIEGTCDCTGYLTCAGAESAWRLIYEVCDATHRLYTWLLVVLCDAECGEAACQPVIPFELPGSPILASSEVATELDELVGVDVPSGCGCNEPDYVPPVCPSCECPDAPHLQFVIAGVPAPYDFLNGLYELEKLSTCADEGGNDGEGDCCWRGSGGGNATGASAIWQGDLGTWVVGLDGGPQWTATMNSPCRFPRTAVLTGSGSPTVPGLPPTINVEPL